MKNNYSKKGMSKVNSKPKGFGKSMSMGPKGKTGGVAKTSNGCCVPLSYAQQQKVLERVTARALRVSTRGRR